MKDYSLLKINLRGGIVSPGTLQSIVLGAKCAGVREVSFGARQQLLMYVKSETVRGSGILEFKKKLHKTNNLWGIRGLVKLKNAFGNRKGSNSNYPFD